MNDAELAALHATLWQPGSISISAQEAIFIKTLITERKPKLFLELGTATGLSTVVIFNILREHADSRMITADLNPNFVGSPSKPTGYLIDEHIQSDDRLKRMVGITSADLDLTIGSVNMCFIDANHQHPWPTLDTLLLWPLIAEDGVVIHHDLRLYQKAQGAAGVGPKHLFDQFPTVSKTVIADRDRNMFYLTKSRVGSDFQRLMSDSLLLPWTLKSTLPLRLATKIMRRLAEIYPPQLASVFATAFDRYNTAR